MSAVTISDHAKVRTVTFNRPESLNAFNEAMCDAVTVALLDAVADPQVSVVLITGAGRAFSAGVDLNEFTVRASDPDSFTPGEYGFGGLIDALIDFPKPLICAVNGVGVGIGTTILGFADLAFMSSTARLKCPFSSLGVPPEASSSYLLPTLIGRQNAAWVLMSSEWISAAEARQMGLVFEVCEPDELLAEATRRAELLASRSLTSLMAVKHTMVEPNRQQMREAKVREGELFTRLMGAGDNADALAEFAGRKG